MRKEDSKMKIQYMSDLHLEFCDNSRWLKHNELPVTGDILVLAGDIFYLKNKIAPLSNFWKWASTNYRQVLIVPGNHEYYNYCDVMDNGLQWNWMFKNEYFVWKGMNDFRQIMYNGKLLQTEEFNHMHNFCLDFIKRSLAESTAEHIVVITHHLPTLEVVAPHHKGSVLNSAFATDLSKLIAGSRIDAWIYGHSHTNIDAEINGTKVICNQMGYVADNEHISNGFDPSKCLSL